MEYYLINRMYLINLSLKIKNIKGGACVVDEVHRLPAQ